MHKIYLALALHFHQPIGNFKNIFERAEQLCYQPFLQTLFKYPDIKLTLHFSGCLLDYLEEAQPQTLDLIKTMVGRSQVELLGGAYYEPILTAIPEKDVAGQIRLMSRYLRERFNCEPRGMWIPERVWESRLAGLIFESGIRYCILDDTHFLKSGIKKEDTYGYYWTGKSNKKIAVFPCDKHLRYSIPFKAPEETIDYFKHLAQDKEGLLFTYGDDGEKFGEWPGTHQWVFQEKWLEKFFVLLRQNSEWIKLIHFSDYLNQEQAVGSAEINAGSYDEMMQWSGGSWSNFLLKYPESNQMHKKMHYVSAKIEQAEKRSKRKDLTKITEAKRELYRGQCNCAYWHGVFGGLYLFHLRSAVYEHLICAEKICDDILHQSKQGKPWLKIAKSDFDKDQQKGLIMENRDFFLYLDPAQAASLKELDHKGICFNLIDTLSRKKEAYHQKILNAQAAKAEDGVLTIHDDFRTADPLLKEKLVYDKFPRYCLRTYFVREDLTDKEFINSSYQELGDFASGAYGPKKKGSSIMFERQSKIGRLAVKLAKKIQIKSEKEIEICYNISKKGPGKLEGLLGVEFNVTMPWLNAERYSYVCAGEDLGGLNTTGTAKALSSFGISDSKSEFGLSYNFSQAADGAWFFPVQTISQSERAYELNYQCSCIFFRFQPSFGKGKDWNLRISWSIGPSTN
ncbi:MAG: DUF1926 domain-containing protein [Candidatus Omnitrophica bacterium]|nr:DUF1926 domain-containing protein [Candidatus Omnitrophota bacterium]